MVKIRKLLLVTGKVAFDGDIGIHQHSLVSLCYLSLLKIVTTVVLLILIILLLFLNDGLCPLEVI